MDLNSKSLFAQDSFIHPLCWGKSDTFNLLKEHTYIFKGVVSPSSHRNFGYKQHMHIRKETPPESILQVYVGLTVSHDASDINN